MAETYSFLIYAVFALTHLAIVATTFITGPLKKGHKASFFLSLPSFLLSGVSILIPMCYHNFLACYINFEQPESLNVLQLSGNPLTLAERHSLQNLRLLTIRLIPPVLIN